MNDIIVLQEYPSISIYPIVFFIVILLVSIILLSINTNKTLIAGLILFVIFAIGFIITLFSPEIFISKDPPLNQQLNYIKNSNDITEFFETYEIVEIKDSNLFVVRLK